MPQAKIVKERLTSTHYRYTYVSDGVDIGVAMVSAYFPTFYDLVEFKIYHQHRRQGHGGKFLKALCRKLRGKTIRLCPEPEEEVILTADGAIRPETIPQADLIRFYEKHGFELRENEMVKQ